MRKNLFFTISILLTIGLFTNCKKENQQQPNDPSGSENRHNNLEKSFDEIEAGLAKDALKFRNSAKIISERTSAIFKLAEKHKSERLAFRNSQQAGLIEKDRVAGVINIPGDYSSLQDAVDNAQTGDRLFVHGELTDQGDVFVDRPDIKIAGDVGASIGGNRIYFLASNIVIRDLNLKINLIIGSDAAGSKVLNNKFTSIVNATEVFDDNPVFPSSNSGLILMRNVSGCEISNNIIQDDQNTLMTGINLANCSGNILKSNTIYGGINTIGHIFMSNSNSNKIIDCTIRSGGIISIHTSPYGGAGMLFVDEFNNNTISGCSIEDINSDGIYLLGIGNNNKVTDCKVNRYGNYGISLGGNNNQLSYCTVTNGSDYTVNYLMSHGIVMSGSNSSMKYCVSNNNSKGIIFGGSGNSSITNCRANNNLVFGMVCGVNGDNSSILVKTCEALNNTSNGYFRNAWGDGINISNNAMGSSVTLSECIASNNEGTGITVGNGFAGSAVVLTGNEASKNADYGILLQNASGITLNAKVRFNRASYNMLCDYKELYGTGTIYGNNTFGVMCN